MRRHTDLDFVHDLRTPLDFVIPDTATQYGFVVDGLGAHSSRTIMLRELTLLLAACPPDASFAAYQLAIVENNVLLKKTATTRRESVRRLRELYSLNRALTLFRSLRDLWDVDQQARPMLALLCAVARDPLLRASVPVVLAIQPGEAGDAAMIAEAIDRQYPGRFNQTSRASVGRHAASSWTQSGHLQGRNNKVRVAAQSCPTSVAYALLLGYLCGGRGEALFNTGWAQLLDAPLHTLHEHAFLASQRGWLEYRHAGAVTEIGFSYLLRKEPGQDE